MKFRCSYIYLLVKRQKRYLPINQAYPWSLIRYSYIISRHIVLTRKPYVIDDRFYRPQRSCGMVMFLHMCVILFGRGGVISVPACTTGHMTRRSLSGRCLSGDLCQGGLCLGVSVQRVSVWGSLSRGFCPGGSLSRGVSVQGDHCPGSSLSRGVSVWGLCPGESMSRVSLSGGLCPGGLCLGFSVQEGFLSEGLSPGVSVWGSLCLGVSVWGSLPRGFSVRGDPPDRDTPVR